MAALRVTAEMKPEEVTKRIGGRTLCLHMYCMQDIIVTAFAMNVHRGRSCAKALRAFAEKFGHGRKF